jgi:quercetin 2,3-dioxygenase
MTTRNSYLVHKSNQRGHTKIDWLDSYHTFSFGNFQNPDRMGFRSLRVINDDRVMPGAGFATHSHRDMEILTYVLEGELAHQDSLRTGATIKPGEVQIMSAGTGIQHSEFNPSAERPVHLLQIWMLPNQEHLAPRYDQRDFPLAEKAGKLRLVASPNGHDGSVIIHQDINLYVSVLAAGDRVSFTGKSDRYVWLQIATGAASFNGKSLQTGDGVQIIHPELLDLTTDTHAEILLFDLA